MYLCTHMHSIVIALPANLNIGLALLVKGINIIKPMLSQISFMPEKVTEAFHEISPSPPPPPPPLKVDTDEDDGRVGI